jgi:PAS domain-containing protein
MADLDRRVLGLLEILHGAPGNPAEFMRFLEALRNAISSQVVVFYASQPHAKRPGILAGSGIGIQQVQLGRFLDPSRRHPTAADLPLGTVIEIGPDKRMAETSLYREGLAPAGVLPGPGFIVITDRDEHDVTAATFVLPRAAAWKPNAKSRALLDRLAPHMVIARRLHRRLAESAKDAEALVSAFDRLVLGVVFVDENERVSYANRSAAELLGVAPGFAEPSVLAADIPDARTRALRRVLRGDTNGDRNATVFAHPEDGRPLQVLITRFDWRENEGIAAARYGRAIFIGDPKTATGDPAGILHEFYGLTRSETRLALLLVADCSVEEAAGLLGITLATARGVLKSVFAKTGTSRQASLVRLLLSGPPGQIRSEAAVSPPFVAPTTGEQAEGRRGPLRR